MKVTIALSTTAMNCAEDNNPSAAHRLVELTPRIVDQDPAENSGICIPPISRTQSAHDRGRNVCATSLSGATQTQRAALRARRSLANLTRPLPHPRPIPSPPTPSDHPKRSAPAFRPVREPEESRGEVGLDRSSPAPAQLLRRDSVETVATPPARLRPAISPASASISRWRVTAICEIGQVAEISSVIVGSARNRPRMRRRGGSAGACHHGAVSASNGLLLCKMAPTCNPRVT